MRLQRIKAHRIHLPAQRGGALRHRLRGTNGSTANIAAPLRKKQRQELGSDSGAQSFADLWRATSCHD